MQILFFPRTGGLLPTIVRHIFVDRHRTINLWRSVGRGGARLDRLIGNCKSHHTHMIGGMERLLTQRRDEQLHRIVALGPPTGWTFKFEKTPPAMTRDFEYIT